MVKHFQIQPRLLYQIKITLKEITPPIWRRVIVPADYTLADLHDVIQISMGWQNAHLFHYRVGNLRYGVPDKKAR